MARSTTGKSKFKIQRSLGLELPGLGKSGALERRPYGPGQHGNKRKKISDLAVRLKEKQKLSIDSFWNKFKTNLMELFKEEGDQDLK